MNENIKAGADIHAGGGYQIGTTEEYEAFVKKRNQSILNSRVKYLANQMGWEEMGADLWGKTLDGCMAIHALEKFTELVIAECLTFVEPMPGSSDIDDIALESAQNNIKAHFGIK